MTKHMQHVLNQLIAARKAAGYTQQQAAESIGLTRASSLSDLETGRNEIKVSQFLALCELYHVSPARIMRGVLGDTDEAAMLLAIIDAQSAEIDELRELRRRVDEAEIALLSDNSDETIPMRIVRNNFAYIWHGKSDAD